MIMHHTTESSLCTCSLAVVHRSSEQLTSIYSDHSDSGWTFWSLFTARLDVRHSFHSVTEPADLQSLLSCISTHHSPYTFRLQLLILTFASWHHLQGPCTPPCCALCSCLAELACSEEPSAQHNLLSSCHVLASVLSYTFAAHHSQSN